jgi:hypothetical protein
MQPSEMKKILGKFEKSTFAYFFALEKVRVKIISLIEFTLA